MDPGPVYETCQRVRRMEPYVSSWMPRFVNNFLELSTWAILEKYNHAHFWYPPLFLAVNHHNIENWVPSILTHNLWLIFMGMRQKKIFFLKKKIKMADTKNVFFKIANFQKNFPKISQIGPWVSRIDWCEGHQCDSTIYGIPRFFSKFWWLPWFPPKI